MRLFALLFATALLSLSQLNIVNVAPGQNLVGMVNNAPDGSIVRVQAGAYFIAEPLRPRANVTVEGIGSVTIHGARALANWQAITLTHYEVGGQTQEGEVVTNPLFAVCESAYPRCNRPDDVYYNDVPMIHVASLTQLKPGAFYFDYERNTIAIGTNPAGARLEAAITPFAVQTGAAGVVIRNLTFEKFSSPTQRAALEIGGGALIEGVTVRLSHAAGIVVRDGTVVRNSRLLDNGQSGGGATGIGAVYEGNVISGNNYARHAKAFAAGGFSKATRSTGFIFRGNTVHHNLGDGVWLDIDNRDFLVENNVVYDNAGMGIFQEIGYGGRILNNVVTCNEGYGGINVTSSVGTADNPVLIAGNVVTVCGKGEAIAIRRDGGRPTRLTDWITVVSNTVHFRDGRGRVILDAWNGVSLGTNIVFVGNTFYTQNAIARHWRFDNADWEFERWLTKYPASTRIVGEPLPMTPIPPTNTAVITNTFTPTNTIVISATFEPTLTPTPTLLSVTATPVISATAQPTTNAETATPTPTPNETATPNFVWRFEIDVDVVIKGWKLD